MIRIGIILAVLTIALMVWSYSYTPNHWKTMVFTTLCIAQMGHALAIRSNVRLTIELNPLTNIYLWGAVLLTTFLQLALIYIEPLQKFFETQPLTPVELAVCFGFSALMFTWVELEKLAVRLWVRFANR